jgi:hypothetical protein
MSDLCRVVSCTTTSRPCLLMDQNEMSNIYRGPSIDASYQVSYHLAKGLGEVRFNIIVIQSKSMFLY